MSVPARRRLPLASLLLALAVGPGVALGQVATPFRTRDMNPLLTGVALPTWPAREMPTAHTLSFETDLANYYRFTRGGGERISLDGEVWRSSLALGWRLGEQGVLTLELPFYRHFGGVLDNAIDAWHSAFNLPDEGRNERPSDLLEYRLSGAQGVAVDLEHSVSGWGDARLGFARRFGGGALIWQVLLELPTGDSDRLIGGVGPGAALTISGGRQGRWRERESGLYWGAGVVVASDAELAGFPSRSVAYAATVGGGWQALPKFGLKAQLDLHGPLYDSPLQEIGSDSVQASFGGWWSGSERFGLEFTLTEDLGVGTAADFGVHLNLGWGW